MAERKENGHKVAKDGLPLRRCLIRLVLTAPMALAGLLLALGDVSVSTDIALVVSVWLCLAASIIVGIVQLVVAVNAATATQQDPFNFIHDLPRICAWINLVLMAIATGALFAAEEPILASTVEVFLFLQMMLEISRDKPAPREKREPTEPEPEPEPEPFLSASGFLAILPIAGALWLAIGSPPLWTVSLVLTWLWIFSLILFVVGSLVAVALTYGPGIQKRHWDKQRKIGGYRGSWPGTGTIPEQARTLRQRLATWLWRGGWVLATWAIWTAGHPLLAGLYLTGCITMLSVKVHDRRRKHGDTAQIDFFAHAVNLLVWWPLVAIGMAGIAIIFIPIGIFSAIWDRIVGTPQPKQDYDWERPQRVHKARCRRAAASYRLREAFEQPDGFVYFMCSEPHQHEHFLSEGGLIGDLGDRVVARDYRRHVLEARNTFNWMAFQQAPEGALLRVNGVSNMRRDLPFIAIVPPRGRVETFCLSEPYRARTRDKGAALKQAEVEVRAAIDAALGGREVAP